MVNNTIFSNTQHYAEILRHIAAVRKTLEANVKKDSSKKTATLEILKTYNIIFILCLREGIRAYEDNDLACMCIDGDIYTCRKQVLLNLISEKEYCELMKLPIPESQKPIKSAEELELELILGEKKDENSNLSKMENKEDNKKKTATGEKEATKISNVSMPSEPVDLSEAKEQKNEKKKTECKQENERSGNKKNIRDAVVKDAPDYVPIDVKDYVDKQTNFSHKSENFTNKQMISSEKPEDFANKLTIPQNSMICDVYTATISEVIDKERASDEKYVFRKIIPDHKYIFYVIPFNIPETGTKVGADIMVCMIDCENNTKTAFVSTADKKTIVVNLGRKREIWISGDWSDYRFESDIRFYDQSNSDVKMEMSTTCSRIRSKNRIDSHSGHIVYRFSRGKFANGQKRASIIHVFPVGVENGENGLTDIVLMEEKDVVENGLLKSERTITATGLPSPILLSDESTRVHGFWNADNDFQIEIV